MLPKERWRLQKKGEQVRLLCGPSSISPIHLFHCDKCHEPLLLAAIWEDECQEIGNLPEVKAVEVLRRKLGIRAAIILATPEVSATGEVPDRGVAIKSMRLYEPPAPGIQDYDYPKFLLHLNCLADQHKANCKKENPGPLA